MAFGAELKDFVAGFQSGYQLVESSEDKERKRNEEKRAQGRYDREGVWHEENRADEKMKWDYNVNQDKMNWDFKNEGRRFERYRLGVDDERQNRRDAMTAEELRIRRAQLRQDQIRERMKNGSSEDNQRVDDVGRTVGGYEGQEPPAPKRVLPDEESSITGGKDDGVLLGSSARDTLEGGVQQASYSPDDTGYDGSSQSTGWREPQRPQEIAAQLVSDLQNDFGLSQEAAIGVVGQLAHESGGFQSLQELNPMVQGSRGGWGYAQWTGPRRRQFEAFAEANGVDPRSYAANYEFLRHELMNTSEGRVLNGLQHMNDSRQAGRYFTNKFLRPGIPGYSSRDKWTDRVASLYVSRGGVIPEYATGGFVGGLAEGFNAARSFTEDDEDEEDSYREPERSSEDTSSAPAPSTGWNSKPSDWFPNAPSKYARGGVVRRFADGGYATALPEDEDWQMQQQMAEDELVDQQIETGDQDSDVDNAPMPEQKALPETEEEVTSQSKSEPEEEEEEEISSGFDDYDSGRKAAREAWKKSQEDFNKQFPDTALEDPELEKAYENYKNGYGAAPHQMMKQVLDIIDPDKKMSPSERNVKAMGYVYRYWEDKGDVEKAKEAAASMLQYYRQNYNKFSAIAEAARQAGDLDTAMQGFVAAYANVPNGKDLSLDQNEDGTITVTVTDQKTGKPISKQIANLEQIAAAAANMNPDDFDNMLMAAAGAEPQKVETADVKTGTNDAGENIDTNMNEKFKQMYPTEDGEDDEGNPVAANPDAAFMNNAKKNTLKQATKNILSVKGNNMSEAEAMEWLDPTSPERFGKKPVPGRKDFVDVIRGGITVRMKAEHYDKIVSDWKKIQRQKAANEQQAATQAEQDAAADAAPGEQTDIAGALQRDNTHTPESEAARQENLGAMTHRQPVNRDDAAITDTAGDVLGGGTPRPLPGQVAIPDDQPVEAAPTEAVPEDQGIGITDTLFTSSKPGSDIVKLVTGTSVERLEKQRGQLEARLGQMRSNPNEYASAIPKYEKLIADKDMEIAQSLRSEIAALERDAANAGENDTMQYQNEIARRKEALKQHVARAKTR